MYINVWNCQASIIVGTDLGAIDVTPVIRNGQERAEKFVDKIGAINRSGRYPISRALAISVEQPRVQEYIEREYKKLQQRDIENKITKWRKISKSILEVLSNEYNDVRLAIAEEIKNNKKLNNLFNFLQEKAQHKTFYLPDEKNITLTQWVDKILNRHFPIDLPESLYSLIKKWRQRPMIISAKIKDHKSDINWFKNFFSEHPEFGWIVEEKEYFTVNYLPTANQFHRWGLFLENIEKGFKYPLLQTVLPFSVY